MTTNRVSPVTRVPEESSARGCEAGPIVGGDVSGESGDVITRREHSVGLAGRRLLLLLLLLLTR